MDFQVTPPTVPVLNVYPTESNFTTMVLNYTGKTLSSPIHVAVVDADLPLGFNLTLRAQGTTNFTKTLDLQPSATGTSTIMVNATLDCATGLCDQPGGTQLPLTQDVNITASSGSYSKENEIQVDLLKAEWLVMVYSAADTGNGKGLLNDIQASMGGNVVDMAATTGLHNDPAVGILDLFATGWTAGFAPYAAPGTTRQPADTIRLYRVSNGTIGQVGETWNETAMNDPDTLLKFINMSMALVPADRNQLIISGHGAGIQGVASDFHNGDTYMSIPQLASALSGVSPKLDVISFDACLEAQIDVLYQLRNYASYFTASELSVPGSGYNYTGFLGSLLTNPDQSTVSYVKVLVSTFNAKYSAFHSNATLAAINATALGGVVSSLNTLSGILVTDYGAHSAAFNATMLQVLGKSASVDSGYPYLDIRSLAQNILLSPQITDQSVRNAAAAVIQADESAVIANSTNYWIHGRSTPIMYEGLTVLLFPQANVPKLWYQMFAGFDNQLSFSNSAHWLPLLRAVNRSSSLSTIAWTFVLLVHPGHQLFLNVYDSSGEQTGINPALENSSQSETQLIPGSIYADPGNGTTLIALPPSIQSFTAVVNGIEMAEGSEPYT
ncbi:MAG: clostripain-related cysteine peptidase, partial [Thaumarchaeota archaeon]|nr:clostripain-related cysteine peptidase [Nitrososphaerota archaeon]